MKKFIIQVAPIIPLPVLRTQVFSYWHSEPLPVGTLVAAPFYFRDIQGIVIKNHQGFDKPGSIKLKNIRSVIEKEFLSEAQVKLAEQIANHYFSPLGSVLKLMVPKIVKLGKKKEKISGENQWRGKIGAEAAYILSASDSKFLVVDSSIRREKMNFDLIRHYLKEDKQCLVLVPEVFFAHNVHANIQKEFAGEVALIHSRVTRGQFYDYWKKIKSGQIKIIVATKQGIFLPFSLLGLIVVEEEQDASFKQSEAMPRYNAVFGAKYLAELTGAKLVLGSSTPSVESYYAAKQKEITLVEPKKGKIGLTNIEIATFDKFKKNPDFPISETLYSRLAKALENNKQAVLFVNRRGFSTRTICENCKKTLKCPKCELALTYSDEIGQYKCLHCSYKMELLSACPSCGGFQFSHRGIGTQTVEKKIKKLFPAARVGRLDADALKSPAKYLKILKEFSAGKIDVLVGTQAVIKGIASKNIELVGAISARDFADGANFNSRLMALSRLFQAANLLNENGTLVIQSFWGGNPLFDDLKNNDLKKYYARELELRKKYFYPPFGKFAVLSYKDKTIKSAANIAQKTFDLLQATGNNKIEVIGPYQPVSLKKRGLFAESILIKFDPGKDIRDLPIRSVLGGLKKGWRVDVEPVSIL